MSDEKEGKEEGRQKREPEHEFTFNFKRDRSRPGSDGSNGEGAGGDDISKVQVSGESPERVSLQKSGDAPVGKQDEKRVKTDNRPRRPQSRKEFEPVSHCPACGAWLDNDIAVKAFEVIREIGTAFNSQVGKNRTEAFENLASSIAENLPILVSSRMVDLDSAMNLMMDVHKMIGPPKVEGSHDSPMLDLEKWLNGDIEEFPDA